MGSNVDNQASRDAARQAQRAAEKQQPRSRSNKMNVASEGTTAFGNILQQSLQQARPTPLQEPNINEGEEKPESQRQEAPKEGRRSFRDTLQSRRGIEDRVQEHQRQRDSQEDSSKDQRQSSGQKDSGQHAKEAEQRVVARQGHGESGRQGQDGGQQGGRHGTGAEQGRQQTLLHQQKGEAKEPAAKSQQNLLNQAATVAQTGGTAASMAAKGGARGIPQHIIDQVVAAARLIQRPDGKTEMEVQLHDEIFKGLRVRVALNKDGKVQATFVTAHRDVRDLFRQERQAIRNTLEEKGLALEGVDVIMI